MEAIGFEQIKRIYDSLVDASSRSIFEKRFMYSLSGDLGYIHEMVSFGNGTLWECGYYDAAACVA